MCSLCVRPSVCESGRSPEAIQPWCKKFLFSAKFKSDTTSRDSLTWPASNGTTSSRSTWDKTEIDKCAHQWRPGDDERAMFGIGDCPCVLRRGRRFCSRRLMPGVLVSKAARWVMSFLASWLNKWHDLPGCARAYSCLSQPRCAATWPILLLIQD